MSPIHRCGAPTAAGAPCRTKVSADDLRCAKHEGEERALSVRPSPGADLVVKADGPRHRRRRGKGGYPGEQKLFQEFLSRSGVAVDDPPEEAFVEFFDAVADHGKNLVAWLKGDEEALRRPVTPLGSARTTTYRSALRHHYPGISESLPINRAYERAIRAAEGDGGPVVPLGYAELRIIADRIGPADRHLEAFRVPLVHVTPLLMVAVAWCLRSGRDGSIAAAVDRIRAMLADDLEPGGDDPLARAVRRLRLRVDRECMDIDDMALLDRHLREAASLAGSSVEVIRGMGRRDFDRLLRLVEWPLARLVPFTLMATMWATTIRISMTLRLTIDAVRPEESGGVLLAPRGIEKNAQDGLKLPRPVPCLCPAPLCPAEFIQALVVRLSNAHGASADTHIFVKVEKSGRARLGMPLSRDMAQRRIQDLVTRAGLGADVSTNSMRHGFAADARAADVPFGVISTVTGWSVQTIPTYGHGERPAVRTATREVVLRLMGLFDPDSGRRPHALE